MKNNNLKGETSFDFSPITPHLSFFKSDHLLKKFFLCGGVAQLVRAAES